MVARVAGVSKMTVSRVVRDPDSVAPATRSRVEAAMRAMGYTPRTRTSRAPGDRPGLIALIVPDVANPFFTQVARGAEDVAHRNGYTLVLCNSDEDPEKERSYLEALITHQLDGAIVVPAGDGSRGNLALLQQRSIPFILCDRRVPDVRADMVIGDSVLGARNLTRHLIDQDYRHIALITGPSQVSTARDRREGYRQALLEAGLEIDARLIVEVRYTRRDGWEAVDTLRSRGVEFDAIVAGNNTLAMGAVRRLQEVGQRVPEDLGVVCFDDLDELYPFFTVMAQPALNFGTISAQMLVERIQGRAQTSAREVVLVPELVIRGSSFAHDGVAGRRRG